MQLDTVVSSWGGKSPELIACGTLSLGQANRDQLESASIRFVGERFGHGGEGKWWIRLPLADSYSSECYHGLDRGISMVPMLSVS